MKVDVEEIKDILYEDLIPGACFYVRGIEGIYIKARCIRSEGEFSLRLEDGTMRPFDSKQPVTELPKAKVVED